MKIIIDKNQPLIDFLKANGNIIHIMSEPFYYSPFVFAETPEGGLMIVHLNSVPKDVFNVIMPKRDSL